jgi:hypothetical protein
LHGVADLRHLILGQYTPESAATATTATSASASASTASRLRGNLKGGCAEQARSHR